MEPKFILSCESTIDMPYSYTVERNLPTMFYSYTVDDVIYEDDMGRDPKALPKFYDLLKLGKFPATSQLNEYQYEEFFDELLQKGDVLHIAFSSGLSGSVLNAFKAADKIRAKYPDRKLVVIDSLCASSGYGLIIDYAADLRDEGKTIDEVEKWVLDNQYDFHHQFFSTDLKYFRRSGRVSGATATVASILNICPIMHLDDKGKIISYDKSRGKKNAILKTVDEMKKHARNGLYYSGKCFISHSNCIETAKETKAEIEKTFKNLNGEVKIFNIGTIIASHTGPGTVSVFFMGDKRQPDEE